MLQEQKYIYVKNLKGKYIITRQVLFHHKSCEKSRAYVYVSINITYRYYHENSLPFVE